MRWRGEGASNLKNHMLTPKAKLPIHIQIYKQHHTPRSAWLTTTNSLAPLHRLYVHKVQRENRTWPRTIRGWWPPARQCFRLLMAICLHILNIIIYTRNPSANSRVINKVWSPRIRIQFQDGGLFAYGFFVRHTNVHIVVLCVANKQHKTRVIALCEARRG